ncbi:D-3-phosphoglycerate dehydrogenase 2 [Colletotrichum chlorophyti]|uniref:D-3-phosphoglycerate dehydrogenase 2 n=1 Tax=Colletotrichum chlorophyti TaxID=708187 RepID=A0A1Q8RS29_9PEZI|nr:D-3-phosphoglycerate dehydrogenase 2 [Colletotrichum chlorophyti]
MAPGVISDKSADKLPQTKPIVYVLDTFQPDVVTFCQENFNAIFPGQPEHINWKENARFLLVKSSRLSAEDIAACPNLLAIGKHGVGINKIDVDACSAHGIKIFNTPGVNARAVAELVLTLTTAVARQVGAIVQKQSSGILVPKETCSGLILHRKTIGILGKGNIGKSVAEIFRGAFDADIVAYDPFLPTDAWADILHQRVTSVNEVLRTSGVLTVHMPLTASTRGLIGYEQLQMMKKTAIVINTARVGIINEPDLERALSERLIWGAGLDCHEQEPPSQERYGGL